MSDLYQNTIIVGGTFTADKITKLDALMEANYLSLDENDTDYTRDDIEHQVKKGEVLELRGEISNEATSEVLDALKDMELDYWDEIGAEWGADGEIRICKDGKERECTISSSSEIVLHLSALEREAADHPEQTLTETLKKMDLGFFKTGPDGTSFEETPA